MLIRRLALEDGKMYVDSGFDEENQYWNAKTASFARKTLLWPLGRKNKVIHSILEENCF